LRFRRATQEPAPVRGAVQALRVLQVRQVRQARQVLPASAAVQVFAQMTRVRAVPSG